MHVEDYMNETPACLLAMLTQTREDLWQAAKALTERGVTRIILTGSGTSYHGALTARSFMQQWCGLPVDVYWPFLLDDSALTLSDKALVIGISQGGGSLSTSPQWNAPGQPGILPLPWPGKRQPLSTGRQIWS